MLCDIGRGAQEHRFPVEKDSFNADFGSLHQVSGSVKDGLLAARRNNFLEIEHAKTFGR